MVKVGEIYRYGPKEEYIITKVNKNAFCFRVTLPIYDVQGSHEHMCSIEDFDLLVSEIFVGEIG